MTVKYTFFVGLNDKTSKLQEVNTLDAARIVTRVFMNHGVDATISNARGIYTHDDGTIVTEETIMVQCYQFGNPVPVADICEDLKTLLNQESIAVEQTETNSALY